jgi:putative membrane protein
MSGQLAADSAHLYAGVVDPFAPAARFWPGLAHAVLATALFRCWTLLLFFAAWSAAVCLISHYVHSLAIQPTLLTV